MNTELTCKCYTRKTKVICGNPAEWITVVWKGSNIYLPGFPSTGGWLTTEAAVCKMHLNNTLKKGKSLEYRTDSLATVMPEKLPFLKEDNMEDDISMPTHNEQGWMLCDGCDQYKPDVSTKHVAEDLVNYCHDCASAAAEEFNNKMEEEMKPKKRVLCGHCRKGGVEDPYHNTTAEVRACYRGVKKVEFDSTKTKKISCGNCKKTHDTIDQVRECYSNKS